MDKTFKNVVTYCKIKVLRGSEKYQTNEKKWVPKWTPKGFKLYALRDTAAPTGNRWMKLVDGNNGGWMDAHRDV